MRRRLDLSFLLKDSHALRSILIVSNIFLLTLLQLIDSNYGNIHVHMVIMSILCRVTYLSNSVQTSLESI